MAASNQHQRLPITYIYTNDFMFANKIWNGVVDLDP